jgi:hypothetical protein
MAHIGKCQTVDCAWSVKRWRAIRAQWFVRSLRHIRSNRLRLLLASLLFPCMPKLARRYEAARIVIPRGCEGDMNVSEENYYPNCKPAETFCACGPSHDADNPCKPTPTPVTACRTLCECAAEPAPHGCECHATRGRERTHNFDVGGEG